MIKNKNKHFRINEEEQAMFNYLTANFDFKSDSDVFRHALVLLYGEKLKDVYRTSNKRDIMTFDEFVASELYKEKKELA